MRSSTFVSPVRRIANCLFSASKIKQFVDDIFTGSHSRRRSCRNHQVATEPLEIRVLMAADVGATFQNALNLGQLGDRPVVRNEAVGNPTDVDMYRFEVVAGQTVGFDIDTPHNGPPGLGSYLRIFDLQGREIAANNDRLAPGESSPGQGAGANGFDSYISGTFSRGGAYFVGVSNWQHRQYNPLTGATALCPDPQWLTGQYTLELTSSLSLVQPKQVSAKPDGSLVVTYTVDTLMQSSASIPVSIYWADGPTGLDALPGSSNMSGAPKKLYTHYVSGRSGAGTFTFTVPQNRLTVAPASTTHLLVVANPDQTLRSNSSTPAFYAEPIHQGLLTSVQLRRLMPNLSSTDAARFLAPLNTVLSNYGIQSLEQKAMFLAQIGWESANLTKWVEGGTDAYFVNKYWVSTTQWSGLGDSTPTPAGIKLQVPASSSDPETKTFHLYFARGARLSNGSTFLRAVEFTKQGSRYVASFAGAIPPRLTSHLLIVDPVRINRVVAAINNRLGNWSPADASNFRGRGPIQLTGRYNYQLFADHVSLPVIMTNPSLVSASANPGVGLLSAGWFWSAGNSRKKDLNSISTNSAGTSPANFNHIVTNAVNGGYTHESNRLANYFRIRSSLIDM